MAHRIELRNLACRDFLFSYWCAMTVGKVTSDVSDVTDVTDVTNKMSQTLHALHMKRLKILFIYSFSPGFRICNQFCMIPSSWYRISVPGVSPCACTGTPPPRSSHLDGAFTAHQCIGVTRELPSTRRPHPACTPCECGGMRRRWSLMKPHRRIAPAM